MKRGGTKLLRIIALLLNKGYTSLPGPTVWVDYDLKSFYNATIVCM